jgi:endoglucanase
VIAAAVVGGEGACGSGQAATNGSDAATGADVSVPIDAGGESGASTDGTTDAPLADAPATSDAPVTHEDAATDAGGVPLPALPLQVSGRWIVDAKGKRFKLAAVNWYGAEEEDFVVAGLDKLPLATIAHELRALGFNAVRLPWSNQMFESDPPIGAALLSANPPLQGKTALAVLDAVIDALAFEGIVVILDDHTSDANWCCSDTDGDGLWYTPKYPEASWIADWRAIVARYASRPAVVGADLRNEPRSVCPCSNGGCSCQVATWGGSDPSVDWHAAAQRGGNTVLGANPNVLVFVEGVNYANDLTGVYSLPVALSVPNRLVYEAHDYAWDHNGLQSAAQLHTTLGNWWGYILAQGKSYTAPVWVGEFGTCHTSPTCVSDSTGQGLWFSAVGQYLAGADIDWSYWALNGTEARGTGRTYGAEETYGVLDVAWSAPALSNLTAALQALQPATQGP